LPEAVLGITSSDMLVSMVGHEMAHVRRSDFARNLGYEVLFSFVACHPAAALIGRRIEATREQSCDEMVTEQLVSPEVYARSLVAVASSVAQGGRMRCALGILDGGHLEQRVRRLMDREHRLGRAAAGFALTVATATLVVMASVASTLSFGARQAFPASAEPTAATQGRLIGMWRGQWTEVLVPKFKAEMDSSPIWLQFAIKDGHIAGTVWYDGIDLIEQQGSDVKLMRVLPKHVMSPMFDVDITGDTVSFKERAHDEVVEHRLEVLQERQAVLYTKDIRRPDGNQNFMRWLTLTRQ